MAQFRFAAWRGSPVLRKARASVVAFVPVIAVRDHQANVLRASAFLIRPEERLAKTAVG